MSKMGIRQLEDLRQRCTVDVDTGCWLYPSSVSKDGLPRVALPPGVVTDKWQTFTARKAGWLLSGKKLPSGHFLFPTHECGMKACCNPEHTEHGTRKQMGKHNLGKNTGSPVRALINRRNCIKQAVTIEKVEEVQRLLAGGKNMKATAAELGIHPQTVARIYHGTHVRQQMIRGASVFALA